jgi:hypothetical protein
VAEGFGGLVFGLLVMIGIITCVFYVYAGMVNDSGYKDTWQKNATPASNATRNTATTMGGIGFKALTPGTLLLAALVVFSGVGILIAATKSKGFGSGYTGGRGK